MVQSVLNSFAYILCAIVIFIIGRFAYKFVNKGVDVSGELVLRDNLAFSLAFIGYNAGLLLAIGSAIVGPSEGLFIDIIDMLVYGIIGVILLNITIIINDKFVLYKFNIKKEIIEDQNPGTGVVEGAMNLAAGLIIFGAITGDSFLNISPIISVVIFWIIGQLAMILTAFVYNKITPYDIHDHIEKDNVAVGIAFAGALIAIANIIRFAVSGDYEDWSSMASEFGYELLIGLIMLPVLRIITDKILLPGSKLTNELINQDKPNIGAGMVEAFTYIGGSILLCWCI